MRRYLAVEKGVEICYEFSKKSDSCVIFLHGRAGNVTGFDPVKIFLEEHGYSCLMIDMRGHGLSSRPKRIDDYKMEKFSDDIIKIIDKEKIKNAFIVGHSMGAIVALLLAKSGHPSVKAAMLIGLPPHMPEWVLKITRHEWFFRPFHKILSIKKNSGKVGRRYVYSFTKYTGDNDPRRNLNTMRHAGLRTFFFTQAHMNLWDATKHLKDVKAKVIFFAGKNDAYYPVSVFKDLHKMTRNSELEITDTGHSATIQTPILVAESILKHLKKIRFKKALPIKVEKKWEKILAR